MKTLYIYGDSFSDPNHNYAAAGNHKWVEKLEKNFKIHNFSLKGSGPQFQLQHLIETIESTDIKDLKQSSLLFFMSDINRHWWKFMNPKDQYLYPYVMYNRTQSELQNSILRKSVGEDSYLVNEAKQYKAYSKFLKMYNKQQGQNNDQHIINIFSTVFTLSNFFHKTAFWPVFNNLPDICYTYDSQYFQIVEKSLYEIACNENIPDCRKNMHLHKQNHLIMEKEIYNWMTRNRKINIKNFKEKINVKE